jgi:hypothetical protein
MEMIFATLKDNITKVQAVLLRAIETAPLERRCSCASAAGGVPITPPD